jgi:hypothetical protein
MSVRLYVRVYARDFTDQTFAIFTSSRRKSWETRTMPPWKALMALASPSMDSMSKWLVGSSKRSICGVFCDNQQRTKPQSVQAERLCRTKEDKSKGNRALLHCEHKEYLCEPAEDQTAALAIAEGANKLGLCLAADAIGTEAATPVADLHLEVGELLAHKVDRIHGKIQNLGAGIEREPRRERRS